MTTLESIEEQVKELNRKLDLTQQLMVFTALASASSPVTSIAANFDGNLIGVTDRYQELYRNNYNRLGLYCSQKSNLFSSFALHEKLWI